MAICAQRGSSYCSPPPMIGSLLDPWYTLTFISSQLLVLPVPNLPASFFPLYSAPESNFLVPDKLPQYAYPALMARQLCIEFLCDLVHGRQPAPRYGREIMMLVMQANVIRQQIQGTVIRIRLRQRCASRAARRCQLRAIKDIVFGYKMARTRVQGAGEEGGEDEVCESVGAEVADHEIVEQALGKDVEEVELRERELVDEHGTEGVEEDLEGAEEGFAEDGVEEEGFQCGGEVGV